MDNLISKFENIVLENKKELGKFYTTNYEYIMKNMYIPNNIINIIEPFAGNGDLLNFIKDKSKYNIKCYDIDAKTDYIIKQDTLLEPPNFTDNFIITNPPYLARNKNINKIIYDKYNTNDLYKCFIEVLIINKCLGGIIIIPLNFISSIRKTDIELRKRFLQIYNIITLNIFEEPVFDDTNYTVCCLRFTLITINTIIPSIKCFIYPSNKEIDITLNDENNYIIGGEIYKLHQLPLYNIERATKNNYDTIYLTNILVKCIDDNIDSKIGCKIVNDITKNKYIDRTPKLSGRSYLILIIKPQLNIEQQNQLVELFNDFMTINREKYNSLFLTNYRESNSIARKRISFDLIYQICNNLLQTILI
jgi:hypothetical protein